MALGVSIVYYILCLSYYYFLLDFDKDNCKKYIKTENSNTKITEHH